ncbi:YbhB/YbcL family Raf kinase inhibitor-like protein [Compostimonas suwonensis]|uniref:PBP family phospholipid-binding protein n=1 Tax=Compostimonas suwonensis TaxID=1048394 RepID=A0A2M9C3X1_9MICO|nr:YbhB/YbcL family Raf kinase inhibitor-like protein [Compostimonas suwonensis]PJJ65212.1 hypothetical protein CLV54_0241 [Compostimonas suwonensis]
MDDYNPYARLAAMPSFTLTSTDVADGQPLPAAQFGTSAGGSNVSPQLSWSGFPADTKSFAVTVYDPDAPTGSGFWHWAVFNIPVDVTSLATGAGAPDSGLLPAGAVTLPNELRLARFDGAAPPEGTGVHRYFTVVHAVGVASLDIDSESTPAILGFNLNFTSLARAIIVPTGEFGGTAA